jgi:hypothetical protein
MKSHHFPSAKRNFWPRLAQVDCEHEAALLHMQEAQEGSKRCRKDAKTAGFSK